MKGILADVHMGAHVDALIRAMKCPYWADDWAYLGLTFYTFEDMGLTPTSRDLEIWQKCQAEQLVFLTNNRNADTSDSLEVAIRVHGTADSLPVFTIGDLGRFSRNRTYAEDVVEQFFDYLLNIDRVRGAGRLYLP